MSQTQRMQGADGIVKRCACGRAFTVEQWRELRLVGVMRDEVDSDEDLEVRNCRCGSTISRRLADMRR